MSDYNIDDAVEPVSDSNAHMILIAGKAGIGKSTLASTFPKTFCLNSGARLQGIGYDRATPTVISSFRDALGWLRSAVKSERFETIVIDDLGHLIGAEWNRLQEESPKAFEYGAYRAASLLLPDLQKFINALRACNQKRGLNIVALAHTESSREKPADDEEYFTNHLDFHPTLRQPVYKLFDTILYADIERIFQEVGEGNRKRVIGADSGERVLRCNPSPKWELVKNSHHLPETIPLNGYELQKFLASSLERKQAFLKRLNKGE